MAKAFQRESEKHLENNFIRDFVYSEFQGDGPMQLKTGEYGEFWSRMKYPNCNATRNP